MYNFGKIDFSGLKCTLGIQKYSEKGLVPRNILFLEFSLKLHFSSRLAVEFEQFLSNQLGNLTVSVTLNYLQNYVEFFRYVENCSGHKGLSQHFFTRKRIFF